MSKTDRAKKRQERRNRHAKPSAPRVIGANDNHPAAVNDNTPVSIRGVALTETQRFRLQDAEERVASRDIAVRRAGHAMLEALDREIDAKLSGVTAERDLAELRGLEALRGLEIGVSTHSGSAGAPRASRDGLETLLTANSITRVQHAAGLLYRRDYELLDPEKGLTPPALDQTRKITWGGDHFAQKRREREEFVRDLEAMIQDEDRTFRGALGRSDVERVGRAVWALREIAGKGSNLRALSNSGSIIASTTQALRTALDCAAIAYGLE